MSDGMPGGDQPTADGDDESSVARDADEPKAVTARMRQWAHRSAADYLGKHSSSVANLHKVMLRRAARRFSDIGRAGASVLAEEAVAFCREHAFVDDASYAEMKVRSGVRRGFSRRRIGAGLAAKGIDGETATEALSASNDLAAALAFAKRRRIGPFRIEGSPPDAPMRQKQAAALARNGFSSDITFRILAMSLTEAEDLAYAAANQTSD